MYSLESHNLRDGGIRILQQLPEMSNIVVAEDVLGHAAVPDTLDHGGMVTSIRVDLTTCKIRILLINELLDI